MKIIDPEGKEREILSMKRINHQVVDAIHKGEFIQTELVEVKIKGKTRTWVNWYSLEDFVRKNPMMVV